MTKSELIPAADILAGLKLLESSINWIKCPFCEDEVSRLRPCVYWSGNIKYSIYVCVKCAEQIKGLFYLNKQRSINGAILSRNGASARLSYGDWGFTLWAEKTRLWALEDRKTPDQKKSYDNTFEAWFDIKRQFEEGKPTDVKATWQ